MHIRALLRRYRERPLGQSLTEFALLLPVFLVVLSAAIDLGRLAYARVTIANVARGALREPTGSVVPVPPADIALSCDPSCNDAMGNTVTVTATGRFNLLTPVMGLFFGGQTITFSSTATNQISAFPP